MSKVYIIPSAYKMYGKFPEIKQKGLSCDDLENLMCYLNFPCKVIDKITTAKYNNFFVNLYDFSQANTIHKIIKPLEAQLTTSGIAINKSEYAHFEIVIPLKREDFETLKTPSILCRESYYVSPETTALVGLSLRNKTVIIDFNEISHLLVAGSTGSGKSVFLNTMLVSLLSHTCPNTIEFSIVDMKGISFDVYKGIPQLIRPIAKTVEEVDDLLNSLVFLMEQRYLYLRIFKNSTLETHGFAHHICIIDEYADLIQNGTPEIQRKLKKIAQLGRQAGFHLVIATQQPKAEVIDTTIKLNFNNRVALKTASPRDSMNILDKTGAEKLLGSGDAIIRLENKLDDIHCQISYTTYPEIEKICDWWRKQNTKNEK